MRPGRRFLGALFGAAVIAALFAVLGSASASVPVPTVIGPLASDPPETPGRNDPFFSTDTVLAGFGD